MKTVILTIMSIILSPSQTLSQPVNQGGFDRLDENQEHFLPPHKRLRKAMEDKRPAQKPFSSFKPEWQVSSGTGSTDSVTEAWVRQYASLGSAYSFSYALVRDSAGNVYVAGGSGLYPDFDYATVKYDEFGVEQWVARYNGPGNTYDYAKALAVDADGNVYVTGFSATVPGGYPSDYATIKYDASGVEQWVARHEGTSFQLDATKFLAVDGDGNVYLTGSIAGPGGSPDYLTIKYNASGVEQWAAQYDDGSNSYDDAAALAIDANGNVYVTGFSAGFGNSEYATIKYDASGVEQWVARYDGPIGFYDYATALTVDAHENVYVTGHSEGGATNNDYATIKYDAFGVEQWVSIYNGPGNLYDDAAALTVDAEGNVFVSGTSDTEIGFDYATIRYNASGAEQWVARYSATNPSGGATSLAVDPDGNIYVTGSSYSGATFDYVTLKYGASGIEQWVARYDAPGNADDFAADLAVDAGGNVYVTGFSEGLGSLNDYATIKYDASGSELWAARYNGPGNADDSATALAVDAAGNVYVTGLSTGSGTFGEYATVKYDASGTELWVARYNGPLSYSDDGATGIALDASGNVYVTGNSWGPTFTDYATIKYDASGVEQWIARYDGPIGYLDFATALAVDADENVFVTGYSEGNTTNKDYATIKYDASGVQQWVSRYDGPGQSREYATALAIDASGDVYVTGRSGPNFIYDYATIKYDDSGAEQWVARYNGLGNLDDEATALAVDAEGNVYVTGFSTGSGTIGDYATIQYDASGIEQWVGQYNGSGNSDDNPTALAVDTDGNIYVTGSSVGEGGSVYTTIKYVQLPTSVEDDNALSPLTYSLSQNYPNPFNPSTTIHYALPRGSYVKLEVFDVLGERVSVLREGFQDAGYHSMEFDARGLSSGIYFYRLQAADNVETKKLVLMR